MKNDFFDRVCRWFYYYTEPFCSTDSSQSHNFRLKINHSKRVCDEIEDIANSENASSTVIELAKISALLHDIGRFEQLKKHETFIDHNSFDHGCYGVKLLVEQKVLDFLDPQDASAVFNAIENHNKKELPINLEKNSLFLSKLLRDADKLDILRIATGYYLNPSDEARSAVELDLPKTSDISQSVYEDIIKRQVVKNNYIQSLTDFKVMQLSWVFDINFNHTLNRFINRGYIEIIEAAIPESDKRDKIMETIRSYITEKSRDHSNVFSKTLVT